MSGFEAKNFWERLNNLALVRFLLLVASGWAIVSCYVYNLHYQGAHVAHPTTMLKKY